ncbi:MAG: GTPase HflX [Halanaerobiales bacterium]
MGTSDNNLQELMGLAQTAGVKVLNFIYHRKDNLNAAHYISSGKMGEINSAIDREQANLLIFNNELSPAQHRNLEQKLDIKVIDRTQLILDIFARHAHTRESKLQVELAQLQYMLPRLKGKGIELSRLAGGIGTRGPGETKLEIDRRRIENKIHRLKSKLAGIKKNREVQRSSRQDPVISLIGYTNAGKSSLLNQLTEAETLVADRLFATLDSTLRSLVLPIGRKVIISDTVGFIDKLPHQLVASFRASLEEIKNSALLIHVIDGTNTDITRRIRVINEVLKDLNIRDKDIIRVFNKVDIIDKSRQKELSFVYPDANFISALTGTGKKELLEQITAVISKGMRKVNLTLPYEKAHFVEIIHESGRVDKEKYQNDGIEITAFIPAKLARQLSPYRQN